MINIASSTNVQSSTQRMYLRPEAGKDLTPACIKEAIKFVEDQFSHSDFDTQIDRDYVIFEFPDGISDSAMWIKGVNDEFSKKHKKSADIASFHNKN